jgi:hypothetical protein
MTSRQEKQTLALGAVGIVMRYVFWVILIYREPAGAQGQTCTL